MRKVFIRGLIQITALALVACSSGGGAPNLNGPGALNSSWTVVGSNVANLGSRFAYEPVSNQLFALPSPSSSGGSSYTFCSISANATANTKWNCNQAINIGTPGNYYPTNATLVADGSGNLYMIAMKGSNTSNYYIVKYTPSSNSWGQNPVKITLPAQNPPTTPISNGTFVLYNGNLYGSLTGSDLTSINLTGGALTTIDTDFFDPVIEMNDNSAMSSLSIDSSGKIYYLAIGDSYTNNINQPLATSTQIGTSNNNNMAQALANGQLYTCGGSFPTFNVFQLPVTATSTSNWQVFAPTSSVNLSSANITSGCLNLISGGGYIFAYANLYYPVVGGSIGYTSNFNLVKHAI
jgi:hypothetical protein